MEKYSVKLVSEKYGILNSQFASMLKWGFNGGLTFLYGLRSLTLYSKSAAFKDGIAKAPPMLEFLTKSVGFSEDEAASIFTKISIFSKCTTKQPELVVEFLKRNGFDDNHLKRLLTYFPQVLRYRIDKTLEPKFRALREVGFSSSNLGFLFSQYPRFLAVSLEKHIIPSLSTLKSLFGTDEQLISLLLKKNSHKLLSCGRFKYLPHNLLLLQSYDIPMDKIKKFILKRPLILICRTPWLQRHVKVVEEKLRIPRTSTAFVRAITALCVISEHKLESYFQVFHGYKWSEADILELIRAQPSTVCLSEKLLRVKLNYYMEELGYGSDFLVSYPAILTYSLEKRIVPRVAVIQALKENQLLDSDRAFYTVMCMSESKFLALYLLPFKDKLPELYDYYVQQMSSGGSLSKT